ncbi:zinc ribbon domain-containing protein [Novosphingobium sp. KCTC 2891]|uniref:zinc ribbon domain-containing protein n=1 Tax=Novosphingobium sp. KCTC 2891 TaxID=2989730 RepID=UPI0022221055|nr:zinc ribbon domain-containing protein [Novosphingobium sp. KCTC 2891]MCW1381557.1 zinc ribbon domain-containing protein [Novosphingobium sp. KCTC 2891]
MDLIKGVRAQERAYGGVLWLVSLVFAGFIIGMGNLVIGDLPLVDEQVAGAQLPPDPQLVRVRSEIASATVAAGRLDDRLEIARLQLAQAQRASRTATDTFRAWIEARTATTDPQQDPEVLSRTRQLEQLKGNERTIQSQIAALENEKAPLEQQASALRMRQFRLEQEAIPAQERARFWQELRVFGLRLLITLPMLGLGVWLAVKKRKSDHWPLARGFVLAAVFVFFVELVPYLPSYGGYVRYAVGIGLTFAAGHFLIKNMRAWLASRQAAEAQGEAERRSRVDQDEAFRKMAAKVCPGCDRPIATTGDAEANYCVHCGLTLFDHCASCNTRKMAFFRHCMTCGAPAAAAAEAPPPKAPAPA